MNIITMSYFSCCVNEIYHNETRTFHVVDVQCRMMRVVQLADLIYETRCDYSLVDAVPRSHA